MGLIIDEILIGASLLGMIFIIARAFPRIREAEEDLWEEKGRLNERKLNVKEKISGVFQKSHLTIKNKFFAFLRIFKRGEKEKIEIEKIKDRKAIGKDNYWDEIVKKIKK